MERNVEEMISNPPRYFRHPQEVLAEPISAADKRKILESWKLDAQRLAESTAENMTGGEEGDLREVAKTLVQLNTLEPQAKPDAAKRERTGVTLGLALGCMIGAAAALLFLAATNGWSAVAREGWMTPMSVLIEGAVAGALVGGIIAAIRSASRD